MLIFSSFWQGGKSSCDGSDDGVQEDAALAGKDGGHLQAWTGTPEGDLQGSTAGDQRMPVPVP